MEASPSLECPVCKDVFLRPLVLECGHSCCEHCIRQSVQAFDFRPHVMRPIICPVCRDTTLGGVSSLPFNYQLDEIARMTSRYNERQEETYTSSPKTTAEPRILPDMAAEAHAVRSREAGKLAEQILLATSKAAAKGLSFLEIQHNVENVYVMLDVIAPILFRHNVASVRVNPREITVIILPGGGDWRSSYDNPEYVSPDASSPPSPHRPPDTLGNRITRLTLSPVLMGGEDSHRGTSPRGNSVTDRLHELRTRMHQSETDQDN